MGWQDGILLNNLCHQLDGMAGWNFIRSSKYLCAHNLMRWQEGIEMGNITLYFERGRSAQIVVLL